jgi:hypothetical protein
MSYPSWRVESWYEGNSFVGFRVVRGPSTCPVEAPNGCFRIDGDKSAMRDAAIELRDRLTSQERDPKILAREARDILRDLMTNTASAPGYPNAVIVPTLPLNLWLRDRLDKLCAALGVKEDM